MRTSSLQAHTEIKRIQVTKDHIYRITVEFVHEAILNSKFSAEDKVCKDCVRHSPLCEAHLDHILLFHICAQRILLCGACGFESMNNVMLFSSLKKAIRF